MKRQTVPESANPYAAPADVAESGTPVEVTLEYKQTTFANAFFRWSLICIVSAAPSFYLGLAMTQAKPAGMVAMLLGIFFYICAYSAIDIQPYWRRWMSTRFLRPAIISAFTIRCVISILFPIGMVNDMIFGILSMSVGSLGKFFEGTPTANGGLGPATAFVVTILQGLLLSLEIAAVAVLIYSIMGAVDRFNNRRSA